MRSLIAWTIGAAQGANLSSSDAGKKAERAPARHVGPGQDDLADASLAVEIGRVGRRDPGLARSGRSEHDTCGLAQRVEIVGLARIERLDRRGRSLGLKFGLVQWDDLGGCKRAAVAAFLLFEALAHWRNPLIEGRGGNGGPRGRPGARSGRKTERRNTIGEDGAEALNSAAFGAR